MNLKKNLERLGKRKPVYIVDLGAGQVPRERKRSE